MRGAARRVRAALARRSSDPAARTAAIRSFGPGDIGLIADTFFTQGPAPNTPWDAWRHAHMKLPDWFHHDLDPLSDAYAEQQHRLWQLVTGIDRPYVAEVDEKEHDLGAIDPVRTPGYYVRRDAQAVAHASDHVIASGMLLKHSGLAPGDWALEYGAGFGQTALALARLGVNVDTVDISPTFCSQVSAQAAFFQVPLTAFHGRFGLNPRPGHSYKLIWFYESFHHCLEFQTVVQQLRDHLGPGGRVILGGEPIEYRENPAVPYPWGVRLHSEVTAVMRRLHWFELGFTEDFLFDLFVGAGFVGWRVDCEPSLFGRLHIFEHRPDVIDLGRCWLPTVLAETWGAAEADGRWTRSAARLPVDARSDFAAIEVDLGHADGPACRVELSYGGAVRSVDLDAGSNATVRFDAEPGARDVRFRTELRHMSVARRLLGSDRQRRGVFVRRLRYVAAVPPPPTE